MQKLVSTAKGLWANHRLATLAGAAAVLIAVVGVVGYLVLKRPGDVNNEDAFFDPSEDAKQEKQGTTNWPFYGLNPERTRYLPADASLKPPFKVNWEVNGRKLLEYSGVIAGSQLYVVNNNGEALALKTQNGKIRWRHPIANLNASSPAYSDQMLYVSNLEPGQVQGLSAKTGRLRWKRQLPGRSESSPVVVKDTVIAGCECGTLYAFDKKTGKTLWQTDLPGEVKAAPAVSDGVAYVGDYSGTMSAVHINDGSIKWQSGSQGGSFGRAGSFYGTAAVAFGRVYATSKDGRMYSYEKESGDLAWSHTVGGELYAGVVAADTPKTDPTIYFGSYGGGRFYALDARSGDERWSIDAGGPVIGAASLIGETVYFADLQTTHTHAVDASNGHQLWDFHDGAYNPVISDGERLYITGYKHIYALTPVSSAVAKKRRAKADQKKKQAQKK